MLTRRQALLSLGALGCALLAGCSGGFSGADEEHVITVGASHTPHALILDGPVAQVLAAEGYELRVVEYEDYDEPNAALAEGELDATFHQHRPFLDAYNAANGTNFEAIATVHYEPMGIYSERLSSLRELAKGATVAVPADPANRARALLLLEQERLITLADDAGADATPAGIAENRKEIRLLELPAEELPDAFEEADLVVLPGNVAMENGHSPADALACEPSASLLADTYANVLVVRAGEGETPKLKALARALNSQAVHDYIEAALADNAYPMFDVVEEPEAEGAETES